MQYLALFRWEIMLTMFCRSLSGALVTLLATAACLTSTSVSAQTIEATSAQVQRAIASVKPALIRIQVVAATYQSGREIKMESAGSGVIITADGYAVTNHHVADEAVRLRVTLSSKEELPAKLVGTDPLSDIAVIKLQGKPGRKFPFAKFGDSSKLKVGDRVLAMGSPVALSQSVTMGIVSNTEMIMPEFLWPFNRLELSGEDVGSMVRWIGHDARIAGGNSGGPLVDLSGQVIGINELQMGLSGAIPSNVASNIATQIIKTGKVSRSWLGIDVQPMLRSSKTPEGVLVGGVIEGSPAAKSEVKAGDIIKSVNGKLVSVKFGEEVPLFNQRVAELPVGKPVALGILRDGKEIKISPVTVLRDPARPNPREFKAWGLTGRDISFLMAKEMQRKDQNGVYVTSTLRGGPSDDAKPAISGGDIILKVGDTPVRNIKELQAVTEQLTKDATERVPAIIEFDRKTERYITVVKLGQDPITNPGLEASKAWIPINSQVVTKDLAEKLELPKAGGIRVTEVFKGKSAEKAGIKVGDIITQIDGEEIEATQPQDVEVFPTMVRRKVIGDKAKLLVTRDGQQMDIDVELMPSPKVAREMKRYRDKVFEFTVRNLTFGDQDRASEDQNVAGVIVESVQEGGWAAVGRLAVGDIIQSINGKPVTEVDQLESEMKAIMSAKPDEVVFHVKRGIRELFVEVQPDWTK